MLSLVLLTCAACSLDGQVSGDIQVEVKDATGAVISAASITITNSTTGAVRTGVSDSNGVARFTQLQVGTYNLIIESAGLAAANSMARVEAGNVTSVPITLSVQSSKQTVEVTDQAQLINNVNAQLQNSTDSKSIQDLPIAGGGPLLLAGNSPGVVPVTPNNPFLGLGSFNSNGGRGRSNNITLDYATATDVSTTGAAGLGTVPLDAIAEFNIITNNFQAEYGRNASAQVQIITKSGSNEFHGDAFDFFRNDKLNARDYFDRTGHPSIVRNNDYGIVGGAPIIKNKLFAFGTYEGNKVRGSGGTRIAVVPTPAQVAGPVDPTSAALLKQLQVPTSPSGTLSLAAPNTTDIYGYSGRVDWNATEKDVFYTRFGYQNSKASSAGLTFIDSNLPTNGASSTNQSYNATMSETHTFSASIVNQALFAFGRSSPNFTPLLSPKGPEVQFADGTSNFGTWNGLPQGRVQNTFNFSDSVTWHIGAHQLKFGGSFERIQANSVFDSNVNGTYVFLSLGDFLAGNPFQYSQRFGNSVRGNRLLNQGYFAQDDFRVSKNLTLNLGVRFERSGSVSEVNNLISNLNLNSTAALGGAGTGAFGAFDVGANAKYFKPTNNWAPAVGFAWTPGGGKLVVRGGYRIAYDFIFLNPITNGRFLPPFMYNLSLLNFGNGNSYSSLFAGTSPFQQQGQGLIGNFGTTIKNFGSVSPIDQNLKNPQVQQWSFTLERELPFGLIGRASYVGTKGTYLPRGRAINLIQPGLYTPPTTLAEQQAQQAAGVYSHLNSLLNAGPSSFTNRIDPRFAGITLVESSANSSYNALELFVARRFSAYQISAAYTWSRSIDDNSDVLGVLAYDTSTQQNPNDNRNNRAVSEFNIPQRFVLTNTFAPVYGANWNRFAKAVFTGWQLSGIFQAQSGFPINLAAGRVAGLTDGLLLGGGGAQRPDLVGPLNIHFDANPGGTNIPNKVTNSGLAQPLVGHFGTLGRNVLRLNPLIQSDMTLGKSFYVTERISAQIQAQVLNLFNNTTFSSPGTSLSTPSTFGYYQGTDTNSRNMILTFRVRW